MRVLPLACLICLVSSAAMALPKYAPEQYCATVASGGYNSTVFNGCLHREQAAYFRLSSSWPRIPAAIQQKCDHAARSGSVGSYVKLEACVAAET